jgi:hypothetical protein
MKIRDTSALARFVESNGLESFGTDTATLTLLDAQTVVSLDWSEGVYKTTMQPCTVDGDPLGFPMYWRVDSSLVALADTFRDLLVLHHTSIFTGQ